MLGINDTEARLQFGTKVNRLRKRGWTYPEIATKLLGNSRYVRGVKKLSGAGYMAQVRLQR